MKKKITLCLVVFNFIVTNSIIFLKAQTTTLTNLGPFKDNALYERALNNQLGVIGNDFYGDIQIGFAPAEGLAKAFANATWYNSHFPIDGYKRTICGTLHQYYIRSRDSNDDDDVHFIVRPNLPNSAYLLDLHNNKIKIDNLTKVSKVNFLQTEYAQMSNYDLQSIETIEGYNDIIKSVNLKVQGLLHTPHFLREAKYKILGEIDLPYHNYLSRFSGYLPKEELNCSCIYGPWVNDRLDAFGGSYHDYLEIHPTEQAWWTYKKKNSEVIYHLAAFGDNSGVYNDRSHYDTDGGNLSFFGTWHQCPQVETFAIPFEMRKNTPTLNVLLENKLVNGGAIKSLDEASVKTLRYNQRDIIKVTNQSWLSVSFEKTGIYKIIGKDTIIRGFIVLKASLSGNSECSGTFITKATFKRKYPRDLLVKPTEVKVTLKSIQCLGVDDGNEEEEIIGYSGATAFSGSSVIANMNITSLNSDNFLLFKRLDGDYLSMKKNQIRLLGNSLTFALSNNDYISIISNLDEDDDNDDNNQNDLDEDDDRLNSITTYGGAVKITTWKVKDLITRKKDLLFSHEFRSGGTIIKLNFEVKVKVSNRGVSHSELPDNSEVLGN